MFSGLVHEIASVKEIKDYNGASRISVASSGLRDDLAIGDSLAVNGVCQTVLELDADSLCFCAYQQTLRKTNLGLIQIGDLVNLSLPLKIGEKLDGHLIQGQVNDTALLLHVEECGDNIYFEVEVKEDLLAFCLAEGAICLDGIALTIAAVAGRRLRFNPSQQTWQQSNLHSRRIGDRLNVEVDLIGRYVAHYLQSQKVSTLQLSSTAQQGIVPEVEVDLPTEIGKFKLTLLHSADEPQAEHLILSHNLLGEHKKPDSAPLVRIHSECLTGEVFRSQRCDCHWQLQKAMQLIQKEGCGAIIYLRQEGRGIGLRAKLQAYKLQQIYQLDTVEANLRLGFEDDLRSYEVAINALALLGLNSIRLLSNNPLKVNALSRSGIHVERVALESPVNPHNHDYLLTKQRKNGHLFSKL